MKLIEMEKVLSELCLSHKDIIYIDKNETAERIRKIPSIDIEPKRGEWKIKQDFGFLKDRIMMCSVCGDYIRDNGTTVNCGRGNWNFCPNCGARMKGADDEDN